MLDDERGREKGLEASPIRKISSSEVTMRDLALSTELLNEGQSRDQLIRAMSRDGLTISEAIRTARELWAINLGEAKVLVSQHPAYQQIAQAAQPLHDELVQEFLGVAEP